MELSLSMASRPTHSQTPDVRLMPDANNADEGLKNFTSTLSFTRWRSDDYRAICNVLFRDNTI
jgi:hypothetical protein